MDFEYQLQAVPANLVCCSRRVSGDLTDQWQKHPEQTKSVLLRKYCKTFDSLLYNIFEGNLGKLIDSTVSKFLTEFYTDWSFVPNSVNNVYEAIV